MRESWSGMRDDDPVRYYAQGNVSQDQYIQFIRHDTLGFEYLDQSKNFAPQVRI